MKRTVCCLLTLLLLANTAAAVTVLPEGYVYEPWKGDTGGVISAEIEKLSAREVMETSFLRDAAVVALPEEYVYEPWKGDTGGVISAEIEKLFRRGGVVRDTAALEVLPPTWQRGAVTKDWAPPSYTQSLILILEKLRGNYPEERYWWMANATSVNAALSALGSDLVIDPNSIGSGSILDLGLTEAQLNALYQVLQGY